MQVEKLCGCMLLDRLGSGKGLSNNIKVRCPQCANAAAPRGSPCRMQDETVGNDRTLTFQTDRLPPLSDIAHQV
jgi:hypothetical protein